MNGVLKWAGDNPLILALGVFAVGVVVLLTLRKPVVVQDNGMSAFYAAQGASNSTSNQLAAVQAQVAGATALATIAGEYNAKITTVRAQTDVELAKVNKDVALGSQELQRQAQNKAYYQGVGQNALQGQALPYLLQALQSSNPVVSNNAKEVMTDWTKRATQFWDAQAKVGNWA
jgi:hypothetical protein